MSGARVSIVVLLVAAASIVLGLVLGRASVSPSVHDDAAARDATSYGTDPRGPARAAGSTTGTGGSAGRSASGGSSPGGSEGASPTAPSPHTAGSLGAVACDALVREARASCEHASAAAHEIEALRADRREAEGEPIPSPSEVPTRLGYDGLRAAMSTAIASAHVAGSTLDGVDCTEYPCVAFGRLAGTEEMLERIEETQALAIYDQDVAIELLWMTSDPSQPRTARGTAPELGLFAMAFYTPDDRLRYGDAIDRRVRVRATEIWNTMRPDDPTRPTTAP